MRYLPMCLIAFASCSFNATVNFPDAAAGADGFPPIGFQETTCDDCDGGPDAEVIACTAGQPCASDNDCDAGERCNSTLPQPECQRLYCSGPGDPCDHASADALCTAGLTCVGVESPTCQPCDCDDGDALTSDSCAWRDGACVHDRFAWRDASTGLTWQEPPSDVDLTQGQADDYCAGLALGGLDWRIPTISELRSLVRGCDDTATGGACGVTDSCTGADCFNDCDGCELGEGPGNGCYSPVELAESCGHFWSASRVNASTSGWVLRFGGASVASGIGGNEFLVRCVAP